MKNSKTKKALLAILASSLVASSLVGCGKSTSTPSTTDAAKATTAPTEKKKIVVWSNNRHDLEYMNKKVKEFNDTNTKGIEIEYVVQADNYTNMLTMAASSNQSPDVMAVSASDGISLKSFVDGKIVQPITSLISDDFKKVNEVDNVKYEGLNVIGKEIYWVPTGMRSGSRLIYNKELFTKSNIAVPKTMTQLVDAAKKITQDGAGKSYGVIFPGQSGPWGRWIEGCAEMSGVTVYDYKNGKFDFTNLKPFVKAVRDMFDSKSTFPGTASMKIDPIRTQFAEGNVGIHGNASQEVGVLTQQFPAKMEWGVAELPTLDGTVKGALSITPQFGWMISAQTKNLKLDWQVIEYFGSESFLKGYLEGGYSLPISNHMNALVDKSKTGRLADFALKDYESVYPTKPDVTPEGKNYADALWAACVDGGPDIDKTIAELNKSYNDALDKAVKMGKTKRLIIKDFDPMHPSKGTIEYLSE
jgi:multiple sugar transport system substrate-binding protein